MYCSIQEAFDSPAPAKRPKKKRERVERFTTDPDRPANVAMPPADHVGGGPQETTYSNILTAIDTDQSYFPHPTQDSADNTYMLEPDWTKQFDGPSVPPWIKERLAAKEAEVPLKPATLWDGQPTLWQKVPTSYAAEPPSPAPAYPDLDDRFNQLELKINHKLDKMFAKLSDLDKGKNESSHIEIILFIIGGLFVLLMLDILVKQGTKAMMMIAAAGGGQLIQTRYGGV